MTAITKNKAAAQCPKNTGHKNTGHKGHTTKANALQQNQFQQAAQKARKGANTQQAHATNHAKQHQPSPGYNLSDGSMLVLKGDGTATITGGPAGNATLTGVKVNADGVITATGGKNVKANSKGFTLVLSPNGASTASYLTDAKHAKGNNVHLWYAKGGDLHGKATPKSPPKQAHPYTN